ncbi:MAG: hypothetical protein OXU88_06715 [Gammaproteobacteria bacterium]|nr:hypothetical protein [Gammaproteobacteria bacterium]
MQDFAAVRGQGRGHMAMITVIRRWRSRPAAPRSSLFKLKGKFLAGISSIPARRFARNGGQSFLRTTRMAAFHQQLRVAKRRRKNKLQIIVKLENN